MMGAWAVEHYTCACRLFVATTNNRDFGLCCCCGESIFLKFKFPSTPWLNAMYLKHGSKVLWLMVGPIRIN